MVVVSLTAQQIDKIARTLYRLEGWNDRGWLEIDPEGRKRWRNMVKLVLKLAEES